MHAPFKVWSLQRDSDLAHLWNEGLISREIAKRLDFLENFADPHTEVRRRLASHRLSATSESERRFWSRSNDSRAANERRINWTVERDAELAHLFATGLSAGDIAKKLPFLSGCKNHGLYALKERLRFHRSSAATDAERDFWSRGKSHGGHTSHLFRGRPKEPRRLSEAQLRIARQAWALCPFNVMLQLPNTPVPEPVVPPQAPRKVRVAKKELKPRLIKAASSQQSKPVVRKERRKPSPQLSRAEFLKLCESIQVPKITVTDDDVEADMRARFGTAKMRARS